MEAKALRLGFMGFGEAGYHFAKGLSGNGLAGMVAYSRSGAKAAPDDPLRARAAEAGVELVKSPRELCRRADVILAVTPGRNALAALRSVRRHLRPEHVYADLSAASVKAMEKAPALLDESAAFVDAAIMGPVPIEGLKVLLLASGPRAARFQELLAPHGMNIRMVEGGAGAASAMKLLRAVFMKGITGLLLETLEAAQRRGMREAVEAELVRWMDGMPFAQVIKRFVGSTAVHAGRRAHEMADTIELLRSLGSSTRMTKATRAWFMEMDRLGLAERLGGRVPDTVGPVIEALVAGKKSGNGQD
jgi:3-hydroxyisobutyrate dehydrogenase-like beta-hydroxyacid dehydrogenase